MTICNKPAVVVLMSVCVSPVRYLKPDVQKKSKHETAVVKKTLNPESNEVRPAAEVQIADPDLNPEAAEGFYDQTLDSVRRRHHVRLL